MNRKNAKPIDFSHLGEDAELFKVFYGTFTEDGMVNAVMGIFMKYKESEQHLQAARMEIAELRKAASKAQETTR